MNIHAPIRQIQSLFSVAAGLDSSDGPSAAVIPLGSRVTRGSDFLLRNGDPHFRALIFLRRFLTRFIACLPSFSAPIPVPRSALAANETPPDVRFSRWSDRPLASMPRTRFRPAVRKIRLTRLHSCTQLVLLVFPLKKRMRGAEITITFLSKIIKNPRPSRGC